MIEDKELGMKLAETEEEAEWERIRETSNKSQKGLLRQIELEKAIEKLAEEKLKEIRKDRGKYIG